MCYYTLNLTRCPNCLQVNTNITSTNHTYEHSVPTDFEPLCPAGELRPAASTWLLKDLYELKCGSCLMFEMEMCVGEFLGAAVNISHGNVGGSPAKNSNSPALGTMGKSPSMGCSTAHQLTGSPEQLGANASGLPTTQQTPLKGYSNQSTCSSTVTLPLQSPVTPERNRQAIAKGCRQDQSSPAFRYARRFL